MNLLAGVGNGLFFPPAAGKRVSYKRKFSAGLAWLALQATATPGQTDQWGGSCTIQRLNQCMQ